MVLRTDYISCALCGFEIGKDRKNGSTCGDGCPLGTRCNLLRCPNCGYEFPLPQESKLLSWLRRIFARTPAGPPKANGDIVGVDQMVPGQRARVVRLADSKSKRKNTLAVYGLVPGSEIVLQQRRPTFVIRVGQTELALDQEIARDILVRCQEP